MAHEPTRPDNPPGTLRDTAGHVLRHLRVVDGFVSGECLSRELGISRMAVSKAVSSLRNQGYGIVSTPRRGHRLDTLTDCPLAAEVQPLLTTEYLGHAWVYEPTMASTNARATQLAQTGAPGGLVVVADTQTRGRGRLQRSWLSPAGCSLLVSAILRPRIAPVRVPQISLVAAVAVRRALNQAVPDLHPVLKWPNDVWAGGRKLAGILCEMDAELDRVHHVVVGLGLNVAIKETDFPEDLRAKATSILAQTGRRIGRPALLAGVLNELEKALDEWLVAADLTPFLGELGEGSPLDGHRIGVEQLGSVTEGTAAGVAPDGRLRLRTDTGTVILIGSGDVHVLVPPSEGCKDRSTGRLPGADGVHAREHSPPGRQRGAP